MRHPRGMSEAKLTPHDERRVAVAAGCDPRTVRAYLNGRPTRSTTAARIRDALKLLDLSERSAATEASADH
jgi:hypothetical protein